MYANISCALKYVLFTLWFGAIVCMLNVSKSVDVQVHVLMQDDSAINISFNRYQAGYVCRERGWEFCFSWSYSTRRLA
ncbi:hypothetical protein HQQ94_12155 [Shewanella sp. VB17]|uniref:hypothetical protein n=1 Tax=Shewanella sp. VB17 TaxID=2739432 RepID=UPI00156629AB|nr:hypothetical protein [Shewanella sp. VB17]NRD73976.1 hypothetical protein [Shewanella sp. VB17]